LFVIEESTTSIEHLSNEFFYEIFDYLEACDIYNAFSNLNHRFQQLLNSSALLFKINLDEKVLEEMDKNQYKPIILLNKQQIFSIEFYLPDRVKDLFSSFIIDSLLSRLESFVVKWIDPDIVIPLLVNLASLPRLVSLTIDTQNVGDILNDIYQLIFALPTLKYNNFNTTGWDTSISLPIATDQQFSTIETLVIDHRCTFDDLEYLTSYTPKLRHLSLSQTTIFDSDIETMLPMNLSNLTYLDIDLHFKTFDELKMIIIKIGSKLNVLRCFVALNETFLDGYQWEQFILRYLPDLKKFYLRFKDTIHNKYRYSIYSGEPNQFASLFWIERRWVLEFTIVDEDVSYSIYPYKYIENSFQYEIDYFISFRKQWYEYPGDQIIKSSAEISKSAKLTIYERFDIKKITAVVSKRFLTIAQIYHLEFSRSKISTGALIRIIALLPDLITLKIHSLSCREPANSLKNKILKVCLQEMDNMNPLDFLLALCPYMNYLKIEHLNPVEAELVLDHVLKKIHHDCNDHLGLLCFGVPAADDQMIKTLQKMIDAEKLLINYTLKRVGDDIYFQWK
jgi:hypothetical protein